MAWPGHEPTTYRSRSGHSNHGAGMSISHQHLGNSRPDMYKCKHQFPSTPIEALGSIPSLSTLYLPASQGFFTNLTGRVDTAELTQTDMI